MAPVTEGNGDGGMVESQVDPAEQQKTALTQGALLVLCYPTLHRQRLLKWLDGVINEELR